MGTRKTALGLALVVAVGGFPGSASAQTSSEPLLAYVEDGSIALIDAAGRRGIRLTDSGRDDDPTWSPDGSTIAFVGPARDNQDSDLDLHRIELNGSGLSQITSTPADEHDPSWSPDGSRIVFSRSDGNDEELYSIAPDGSQEVQLTDNAYDDIEPAYSPDGSQIAFASTRDQVTACHRGQIDCVPAPEIYVMNADGSDPVRITVDIDDDDTGCCGSPDHSPTWAPDGRRILFERHPPDRTGRPYIAIMNSNGTEQSGLVSHRGGASQPDWLPGGKLIAFTRPEPDPLILIASASGACTRVLVAGHSPAWEPGTENAPEQFCPAPTIRYNDRRERFAGEVDPTGAQFGRERSDNKDVCRRNQTLILWERRSGPDLEVGRDTTNADGNWSIFWPTEREGNFYVTLEAKRETSSQGVLVFCAASRSVALPVPPIAATYSGPPPVVFTSGGARQRAARGTYSWCRSINYYLGSCLHADAFGYPFPEKAETVRSGAIGRITFRRGERPKLSSIRYWRKLDDGFQPEPRGRMRRIEFRLRPRQGPRFVVWDAVFRIPRRPGHLYINFGVGWEGSRGTGSGGGDYGLHLRVR